jgi:hypothetical protein
MANQDQDRAMWGAVGGFLLTASLATIANLVRGPARLIFAIAAGLAAIVVLTSFMYGWPIRRLGPGQGIENRALRIANRVRRCTSNPGTPFEFSSPFGLRQTVIEHLDRADREHDRQRARRYTSRLHRQVRGVINELAIAGYKNDDLRRYLVNDVPDESALPDLAMKLRELADRLYRDRRGLGRLELGS